MYGLFTLKKKLHQVDNVTSRSGAADLESLLRDIQTETFSYAEAAWSITVWDVGRREPACQRRECGLTPFSFSNVGLQDLPFILPFHSVNSRLVAVFPFLPATLPNLRTSNFR